MPPRFALIASLIVATAAVPATAQTDGTERATATIAIDDLNLARPADQARLNIRVDSTIRRLCAASTRSLSAVIWSQRCAEVARDSVAPQISHAIALAQRQQRLALLNMRAAN